MTRPTAKPLWATDANYPADAAPEAGSPTKVAYTLGQATIGWRPKGKPPAQELNTWQNLVSQWVDYLDNGVFADVAMGADILDLDPDGSGALGNIGIVRVSVTADGPFALRSMIDGEHGRRVLLVNASSNTEANNYAVSVFKKRQLTIAHMDGAGTGKKFYFPGIDDGTGAAGEANASTGAIRKVMLDAGAAVLVEKDDDKNAWIVIGMCGCRREQRLSVHPAGAAFSYPTDDSYLRKDDGTLQLTDGDQDIFIPFSLPVGSIITGFELFLQKQSDDTGNPIVAGIEIYGQGSSQVLTTASNDDDSPGDITLSVAAGTDFGIVNRRNTTQMRVTPTGGAVGGTDILVALDVIHWTPPQT